LPSHRCKVNGIFHLLKSAAGHNKFNSLEVPDKGFLVTRRRHPTNELKETAIQEVTKTATCLLSLPAPVALKSSCGEQAF